METSPKIAKAEIFDMFSKLRITAHSPGQTNIILFDRNSRKILDIFRVNVESSLYLPEKIVLNIGSEIRLFGKDQKKKSFIETQDLIWITENEDIASITSDGILVGNAEGATVIKLVSTSNPRVHLKAEIIVSSLNNFNIDLKNMPEYITDSPVDANYKSKYR